MDADELAKLLSAVAPEFLHKLPEVAPKSPDDFERRLAANTVLNLRQKEAVLRHRRQILSPIQATSGLQYYAPPPCKHLGEQSKKLTAVCVNCRGTEFRVPVYACRHHGLCTTERPGVMDDGTKPECCVRCRAEGRGFEPADKLEATPGVTDLILDNSGSDGSCPGDLVVMSAAVEALHRQFPGSYRTAVRCNHPTLFDNNPYVVAEALLPAGARVIRMKYNAIHRCNSEPTHFMVGFVEHLATELGIDLKLRANRPALYLSPRENIWPSHMLPEQTPYCLVNAGHKNDYTAKFWGRHNFQTLVSRLSPHARVVQVGNQEGNHSPLDGVVNLVNKTSARDLIHLARHCTFAVGPSTFLQHVCAALQKPYVCLLGGREPVTWTHYPTQVTLSTNSLPCCATGSCFRNKTVKVDDDESLCDRPVDVGGAPVPECLAVHTPESVADVCLRFLPKPSGLVPWSPPGTPDCLWDGEPKLGVVIGTHGSLPYIRLHLELRKRNWPSVPCLVVDDASEQVEELRALCDSYGCDFAANERRLGHAGGDMNVFTRGLAWAAGKGVDLLVKFSRRWLFTDDWQPNLLALAEESQHATYSNRDDSNGFGFRTECLGMHVPSWAASEFHSDIAGRTLTGQWLLPERLVHIYAERIFKRSATKACRKWVSLRPSSPREFATWNAIGTSRRTRFPNVYWHETHTPSEYAALAESLGVGCDNW